MRNRKHSRRGITLIELIVVLAVAGIISAIAIPIGTGQLESVRARQCQSSRETIYSYFVMDRKLNGSSRSLDEWLTICLGEDAGDRAVSPCPDGGEYTVQYDDSGAPVGITCSVHGDL